MLKLRDGRLHVFKQSRCQNYYYRFFVSGKYITRTTQTANLALAKSVAENAFDTFKFTATNKHSHSFDAAERGLLTSLSVEATQESNAPSSKIQSTKVKLSVLRKFFGSMTIDEINKTKKIEEYVQWRREVYKTKVHRKVISNKTLRRDFDVLRGLLKFAKREDWIDKLCDFPRLSSTVYSRGWFTLAEWTQLRKFALKWIAQTKDPNERQARNYVYDWMIFLVHTGIRVDEALWVRYEDVLPDEQDPKSCYITIRGGKLSYRMKATECVGMVGATNAIKRRKATNPEYKPTDLLFPKNPREKLNELLGAVGLRTNEQGDRRTAKNFRHTFIMLRLLQNVDVYKLAKNCRTSVKMIESHYGSYINARMSKDELTKFKKDTHTKGVKA